MLSPFTKEDGLLNQKPFIDYEVQYNLFHRIIEGDKYIALKDDDNNVMALQNPGHRMWLWINDTLKEETIFKKIDSLSYQLKDEKLSGIAGDPKIADYFADRYSKLLGVPYEVVISLESYHCPEVIKPQGVPGKLILPQSEHLDIIAEYLVGFLYWSYNKKVPKKNQISTAEKLIDSGNLFLLEVEKKVVSMAYITHRSPRHARINTVYTPPEERKNGYASKLVAELSKKILEEGLTPVLYADTTNPTSNRVYKNIGYIESGKIDEIKFIYELV